MVMKLVGATSSPSVTLLLYSLVVFLNRIIFRSGSVFRYEIRSRSVARDCHGQHLRQMHVVIQPVVDKELVENCIEGKARVSLRRRFAFRQTSAAIGKMTMTSAVSARPDVCNKWQTDRQTDTHCPQLICFWQINIAIVSNVHVVLQFWHQLRQETF